MKIIKLESENIKRLSAVQIEPDGSLVVIGGRNNQGKTSVLDSIEYALAGTSSIPSEPIRRGEKKARVVVEMDGLIVTRTFSSSGSKLVVSDKQGFTKTSPQQLLDSLTGKLSFDPLAFSRMKPTEQLKVVKELAGIDLTKLDEEKQKAYDERTQVNREMKSLQAQVEGVEVYKGVPKEEISSTELLHEYERKMEINRKNQKERELLSTIEDQIEKSVLDMEIMREDIRKLREKWDKVAEDFQELNKSRASQLNIIQFLQDEDTNSIHSQISQAEEINQKVRSNLKRSSLEFDLDNRKRLVESFTEKLDKIEEEKVKLISSSKLPIPNLSFDESGIAHNGLPFNQLASSLQLKISVAMGFAMNPNLKILLIRDGSLLDEDSLKMVAKMAEKENGQLWIERVGESKECQVIIEDGRVKE